jgi:hypothetical protein
MAGIFFFRDNFQAIGGTHAEITDLILKSFKKYSPCDTIPLMDGGIGKGVVKRQNNVFFVNIAMQ